MFLEDKDIQLRPHIYYFQQKHFVNSDGIVLSNEVLFKQYLEGWIIFLNTRTYTLQQKLVQFLFFCFFSSFFRKHSTKTKFC